MNTCLTCKHWEGNRAKTLQAIEECGEIVMDWVRGWPESGPCGEAHRWMDVTVNGDAVAFVEVSANFGCPLHTKESLS